MLVLSRRENDRIDFPALGISVEVVKLTRSRATLAINAPRHIRICRHEMGKDGSAPLTDESYSAGVRRDVVSRIQDEINAATEKLKAAQEELSAGHTDQALIALAGALAELDALRYGASGVESDRRRTPSQVGAVNDRAVAGGVAEAAARYTYSADQQATQRSRTVVLVAAPDDDRSAEWSAEGYEVTHTSDAMTVLYELSRYEKPDAVVLSTSPDDSDGQSTVRLIRTCSQHPHVPILFSPPDRQTV
ncbi:carbon storage regulator [Stieleria maiorica]|uniref:Carbon storage regulator n=1 Tax=Stieleria maiorica TaxID=2795974 RepID=A0A5B9M8I2_9BACT|nr:carbon storage regulator [Stieleria maiorica]QEF96486.1 carbon storage regulator [Stieleria maiorica]